jgi:hypothetical protein
MKNIKRILNTASLRMITVFILASSYLSAATAQDKKVEIDIGVNKEPVWYQQPWAWVVGAAIFILLLVALLRGSRKR